ncbi:hypothetical protein C8F04DRAFT_1404407 [Mycena alexandri]|uniref:Uncharacterized protein n=1 Tax=Mycena alexandri TaxID=1745969 RepID=A0AAD6S3H3_9AGAR|nr:hypothetical protein C8F04DRAFT_1404407 [Mycena alexandri]
MVSVSPPFFPPELERAIFEIVAHLQPAAIPSLLLVSRRVHEWIERVRYQTVTANGELSSCRFQFLHRVIQSQTKPRDFFADRVQHLFVEDIAAEELEAVLSVCTGIRFLIIFGFTESSSAPTLALLQSLRPHRLHIPLQLVMDARSSATPHPIFTSLTHLDIFHNPYDGIDHLASLPALTHLALLRSSSQATQILARCSALELLVDMHADEPNPDYLRSNDDVRFVSIVLSDDEYVTDWVTGTRGGLDFWARGNMFVAKKCRGEIKPSSRCWIEDGDGI